MNSAGSQNIRDSRVMKEQLVCHLSISNDIFATIRCVWRKCLDSLPLRMEFAILAGIPIANIWSLIDQFVQSAFIS